MVKYKVIYNRGKDGKDVHKFKEEELYDDLAIECFSGAYCEETGELFDYNKRIWYKPDPEDEEFWDSLPDNIINDFYQVVPSKEWLMKELSEKGTVTLRLDMNEWSSLDGTKPLLPKERQETITIKKIKRSS